MGWVWFTWVLGHSSEFLTFAAGSFGSRMNSLNSTKSSVVGVAYCAVSAGREPPWSLRSAIHSDTLGGNSRGILLSLCTAVFWMLAVERKVLSLFRKSPSCPSTWGPLRFALCWPASPGSHRILFGGGLVHAETYVLVWAVTQKNEVFTPNGLASPSLHLLPET